MSNEVSVSEVLEFAVESPSGHIGYLDAFYFDETDLPHPSVSSAETSWRIPAFRLSLDSGLFRKHLVLPQASVERIDVSSRRLFLKNDLPAPDTNSPITYLHRTQDLLHFHIHTPEGSFGRIEDLIFHSETWAIKSIVVHLLEAHSLLRGKYVLISPQQIQRILWAEKKMDTSLHTKEVKNAPEFKPTHPLFQATHWLG